MRQSLGSASRPRRSSGAGSRRWILVAGLLAVIAGCGLWLYLTSRESKPVLAAPVYRDLERANAAIAGHEGFVNVDIQVAPDGETLLIAGEVPRAALRDELNRKIEELALEAPVEWQVEVVW